MFVNVTVTRAKYPLYIVRRNYSAALPFPAKAFAFRWWCLNKNIEKEEGIHAEKTYPKSVSDALGSRHDSRDAAGDGTCC